MSLLSRTEFVLQVSKQHVDALAATDQNKALIGVLMAFLVCISFYSEVEAKIIEMVRKRLSGAVDAKIANLIVKSQERIFARLRKNDLAE